VVNDIELYVTSTERRHSPVLNIWGLCCALLIAFAFIVKLGPISEPDVYWHLRMGADILSNHRFTGSSEWTFGPHLLSWSTTQPASEVLLHLIDSALSWSGLALFRSLGSASIVLSTIAAAIAVTAGQNLRSRYRSAFLVAVIVFAGVAPVIQERPQTLSFIVLPWIGLVAMRVMYTNLWPAWWVIGPAVMVWSWFHGVAILVGPLLIASALIHGVGVGGLRWLEPFARSMKSGALVIVAVLIAPMIGPLGIQYYSQSLAIRDAAQSRIIEWLPATTDSALVIFLFALFGVWVISVMAITARSHRVWRTIRMDAMFIFVLFVLGISAARFIPVCILLVSPLVARRVTQSWPGVGSTSSQTSRRLIASGLVAIFLVTAGWAKIALPDTSPAGDSDPQLIWNEMRALGTKRYVIVDYDYGGQAQVVANVVTSLDGRADRYGAEVLDRYSILINGKPGWGTVLKSYSGATDAVVKFDDGIRDRLISIGWRLQASDAGYVWLVAPGT